MTNNNSQFQVIPNYVQRTCIKISNFFEKRKIIRYLFCINILLMEYVPTKLYEQLLKFKNGEIDANEIDDELISNVTSNGLVEIVFDSNNDYIKLFPYDESDLHSINIVFSEYYYKPALIDDSHILDEWDNVYIIGYFNEENDNKLKQILHYFGVSLNDDEENNKKVIKLLDDGFSRYTSDIREKYHELLTESYEDEIRSRVTQDICNFFNRNFIILETCFRYYHTTVDNLIELFDEYKPKRGQTLEHLLKKIARNDSDVTGDFYSDLYNISIDKEEFNREVSNILDNMLESIEDNIEFKDVDEYREIMKTLSNYSFDVLYQTPKNHNVRFQIFRVDPETNLIKLRVFFNRDSTDGYMSLDNFKLLLYHPELFPLFEE